jgi:hypothetical protein
VPFCHDAEGAVKREGGQGRAGRGPSWRRTGGEEGEEWGWGGFVWGLEWGREGNGEWDDTRSGQHKTQKMRAATLLLLAGAATAANPGCIPSCLANTPPMGWRSWNAVAINVNDSYIRGSIDGIVLRRNTLWNGTGPVSLYDLGYTRVGIDDGWEDGGAGVNGSFHDAAGVALVRKDLFPDMRALAEYSHSRGVFIDGYRNNDGNCASTEGEVNPSGSGNAGTLLLTRLPSPLPLPLPLPSLSLSLLQVKWARSGPTTRTTPCRLRSGDWTA